MSLDSRRQHRELGGNRFAASQALDSLDDRPAPGRLDLNRHVACFPFGMLVLRFRRRALLVAAGKADAKQPHDHPPSTVMPLLPRSQSSIEKSSTHIVNP